jgi:hypothetical protein
MELTSKRIIDYLEREFPKQKFEIRNGMDINSEDSFAPIYQFMLGITYADRFQNDISHYKLQQAQVLEKFGLNHKCLAYPFKDYDIVEAKLVLDELAQYYEIEIETERMIKALNIGKPVDKTYYIVVTIVQSFLLFGK